MIVSVIEQPLGCARQENRRDDLAAFRKQPVELVAVLAELGRQQHGLQIGARLLEVFFRDDHHFPPVASPHELRAAFDGGVDHVGEMLAGRGGLPVVGGSVHGETAFWSSSPSKK
jgi:hypothetical protein